MNSIIQNLMEHIEVLHWSLPLDKDRINDKHINKLRIPKKKTFIQSTKSSRRSHTLIAQDWAHPNVKWFTKKITLLRNSLRKFLPDLRCRWACECVMFVLSSDARWQQQEAGAICVSLRAKNVACVWCFSPNWVGDVRVRLLQCAVCKLCAKSSL